MISAIAVLMVKLQKPESDHKANLNEYNGYYMLSNYNSIHYMQLFY